MKAKTKKPEITVLMPVYNGEKYLREAIDSILNQKFNNFELIIINDGSTDKSDSIITSYSDRRIFYVKNRKNEGLIFSLNLGLEMSRGKYIARMDQDDISLPQRFSKQYYYLKNNREVVLVGSWAKIIDKNGKEIREKRLPTTYTEIKFNLLFSNPFIHSSIFFRKDDITKLNGYSEKYVHAEDYALYSLISKKNKIINIPEFLINFRVHNRSIGKTPDLKMIQEKSVEEIIYDNINYYTNISNNGFIKYYNVITNKEIDFKSVIKSLIINKKIYKGFTETEKLSRQEKKKIRFIYRSQIKRIVKIQIKKILSR